MKKHSQSRIKAVAALILLLGLPGVGCATLNKVVRMPVGLVVTFAEILDQSSSCFLGITEALDGPWFYRNTCDKPVTVVAVNRSYK